MVDVDLLIKAFKEKLAFATDEQLRVIITMYNVTYFKSVIVLRNYEN